MTVSSFPTIVETHTAVVVLFGDRVWKAKKPVRFPFVDFTSVEARREACEREVVLNRRFAPDVYLGIGEFTGPDGGPSEPVIVMRRLPDDRRLSTLVLRGEDVGDALRALAHRLATVHAASDPAPASLAAAATRDGLRDRWELLISQADAYRGTVLDPQPYDDVVRLSRRYLDGRAPLFDARVSGGFVGDGHGDLLADDVYVLDDGPRALDCLEFDPKLRCVDGLDDAAFLAMDLERLGAPQLAKRFLDWFVSFRGDPAPASLADVYIAYRAFVRSTVTCHRVAQEDPSAAPLARSLMALAARHLARARVRLVLVGGSPGTGKSTLAFALAARLGFTLLRSDVVRRDLVSGPEAYTDEWKAKTYATMLDRARVALVHGESVVLDASWTRAADREAAAGLAAETASDLVELRCVAPVEVAASRAAQRLRRGVDASDAGADVARLLAARADPWPSAVEVDTTGAPDATLAAALRVVAPAH